MRFLFFNFICWNRINGSLHRAATKTLQLGAKKRSDTRSSGCLRVCVLPDNLIVRTQKSTWSTTSSWRNVKWQCVHDKHRRDMQNQHNKCPFLRLNWHYRKKKRSGSISHLSTDPQAINTEEEKRRNEFRLKTPAIRTFYPNNFQVKNNAGLNRFLVFRWVTWNLFRVVSKI